MSATCLLYLEKNPNSTNNNELVIIKALNHNAKQARIALGFKKGIPLLDTFKTLDATTQKVLIRKARSEYQSLKQNETLDCRSFSAKNAYGSPKI